MVRTPSGPEDSKKRSSIRGQLAEPVREILYDRMTEKPQEVAISAAQATGETDPASLSAAFLEDHRHLTQGLSGTLSALDSGDVATAIRTADELDQHAGPHIKFEEEYFYPEVAKSRGDAYVTQLFREHDVGRQAIQALLHVDASRRLTPDERSRIQAGLREALDHAVSCGTLLSHVTTLDAGAQQRLLKILLQLRNEGGRWSERVSSEGSLSG